MKERPQCSESNSNVESSFHIFHCAAADFGFLEKDCTLISKVRFTTYLMRDVSS